MSYIIHVRFVGLGFFPFLPLVYRKVAVKIIVSGLQDYTIPLLISEVVLFVWLVFFSSLAN